MMKYIIALLVAVGLYAVLILLLKFRQYKDEHDLFDLVSWCCGGCGMESQRCQPLLEYLRDVQIKLKLEQKYCVLQDETENAQLILDSFGEWLAGKYFRKKLTTFRQHTVSGLDYFMATLCSYLGEHECNSSFLDRKMHDQRVSYKSYSETTSIGPYDASYSLTDFAITFFKLYYTAYLFCSYSNVINPKKVLYNSPEKIKWIIDKEEISISRW